MKNTILILAILITFSCKAQIIKPLIDVSTDDTEGVYYKDIDNDLDKFLGTWVYQNGNTIFTVVFEKTIKTDLEEYYIDELSGWYKYEENGIVKVNTLTMTYDRELISGFGISDNRKRIVLHFYDNGRPAMMTSLILDYIEPTRINGVEYPAKLDWKLYQTGVSYSMEGEPDPLQDFRVPTNSILTKQ